MSKKRLEPFSASSLKIEFPKKTKVSKLGRCSGEMMRGKEQETSMKYNVRNHIFVYHATVLKNSL